MERDLAPSSFARGLRVMIGVAERGEASAEELANDSQIPLSTVYRYLKTLRSVDLVEEHGGRYIPGWRLLELSGRHLAHSKLVEISSSVLSDIVDLTGETAVLTVRVGHQAMCLRQVESSHAIRYAFRINQLLPLHAGAGQRVLLAFAPPSVVKRVLEVPLRKFTDQTHTVDQIRADLEQIRRTGIAVSRGELNPGAVAVAMPVVAGGEVLCAICLAGPENRCDERWRKAAHKALVDATARLARAIEGAGDGLAASRS